MVKYAAFLRGINVGGYRKIKMDRLKEIFESAGLKNVITFIQSGNVIFDSASKNSELLRRKIEKHLHQSLGYEVTTLIRTSDEIKRIIEDFPFKKEIFNSDVKLYITFLPEKPGNNLKIDFQSLSNDDEIFIIKNREIYYSVKKNLPKQIFSNNLIEKKFGIPATTRNITTVTKISEKM